MKLYQKILFIAVVIAALLISQDLSWRILGEPAEPLEIAAGSDDFVTVQITNNEYALSFWNEKGSRLKTMKLPFNEGERIAGLDFADDKYYLWVSDGEDRVKAYAAERESGFLSSVSGVASGELIGTQATEDNLYFVTSDEHEEDTFFYVYRAESDASEFSRLSELRYDFRCRGNCYPRKAVYLPEVGELVVLDLSGSVRILSKDGDALTVMSGAESILSNEKGYIFAKMTDGRIFYINTVNGGQRELFCEADFGESIGLSVYGELRAAALFRDIEDKPTAAIYANGRVTVIEKLRRYSILLYLPLFVMIAALVLALELLAAGCVRYAAERQIPLTRRISAVCVMTATVILALISVIIYGEYDLRKKEQQWDRLNVSLNNISVFLESGEQTGLSDKLKTLADMSSSFLPNEEGFYCAVFQRPEHNGLTPTRIYGRYAAERISELVNGNEKTVSFEFRDNGDRHIALAGMFEGESGERAVIAVDMPISSGADRRIIFADILLFGVFAFFLLLLLVRIRRALLPLSAMENRVSEFCRDFSADPVKPAGHNEITMLTERFNEAISELSKSIKRSEKSAAAYRRFVSADMTALMGKENLSEVHTGDVCKKTLVILYADIRPKDHSENTRREFMRLNMLYERVIPVITANGGMIRWESAMSFKALFYEREFEALCAAVTARELSADDFDMRIVIDRAETSLCACGTEEHTALPAEPSEGGGRISLMKEIGAFFGAKVIVSGEVGESVPRFSETFNHRTLGVFKTEKAPDVPLRIFELKERGCKTDFDTAVSAFMSGKYSEAFSMFFDIAGKNPDDTAAVKYLYLCDEMLRRQLGREE